MFGGGPGPMGILGALVDLLLDVECIESDEFISGLDDGATLDDSATAFRFYGGFDFNEYFSVEAQYIDFGSIEDSACYRLSP